VAREDTELWSARITVGDFKAETISIADGVITVEGPLLVLGTSARLNNDISVRFAETVSNLATLDTQRILVDSDNFLVQENLEGLRVLLGDITANKKRSLNESPEREVSAIFIISHTTVADLEHIGIVPATRARVISPLIIDINDADHALPAVEDITSCTPAVTNVLGPLGGIINTPLAHGIKDSTARLVKSITHDRITLLRRARRVSVAIIILQIVHTPLGVGLGIDFLIADGTGAALASASTSITVKTELHSLAVSIIGKSLDTTGECHRISDDNIVLVTADLPAIIKVDIVVTSINETKANKGIDGILDKLLVDVASELVPRVPTHLWGTAKAVIKCQCDGAQAQYCKNCLHD